MEAVLDQGQQALLKNLFHIQDEQGFFEGSSRHVQLEAHRNLKMDLDLFEYAGLHPEVLVGAVQLQNLSLAGDGVARDPDGPCHLQQHQSEPPDEYQRVQTGQDPSLGS